ncbi:MAG TPA: DinB family protein [Chryseosolibacter sp.]
MPKTREDLLAIWDRTTEQINSLWPHITAERFQEVIKMFGQYEGPVYWSILYFMDNEIHHRGQGYVYLRSLGITPPMFWER